LKNLLEYIGIEPERLHFTWISSAEAGRFQEKAKQIVETVKKVGPAMKKNKLIKNLSPVALNL